MNSSVIEEKCIPALGKVNSKGFQFVEGEKYSLFAYSLPSLEFQIALILILSHASHLLLKRLQIPTFISQIIAGIVMGQFKLTEDSTEVLGTITALGYALFIFQSAVKTDLSVIKNSGMRTACLGAAVILLSPLFTMGYLRYQNIGHGGPRIFFISSTSTMISFPVVATLLNELKILNSELGRLGLSSALVADLGGINLAFVGTIYGLEVYSPRDALIVYLTVILFIIVVVFILGPTMKWVVRNIPEDRPADNFYVYAILFWFILGLIFTERSNLLLILYPLILGLAVPDGPPLGSAVLRKFECILSGLLVPICVATISMKIKFSSLKSVNIDEWNCLHCSIATLLIKLCVTFMMSLTLFKMPIKDSTALALILSIKGIVDMGFFSFAYDAQMVSDNIYTMISLVFLSVATFVPMLVKLLYDPSKKYATYQKRNIMDLQPKSKLEIVACVHVPNDVYPIINLLDVTCPTRENPLAVNVLHLVKLIGRATPLFISHRKQPNTISEASYLGNATLLFYQFQLNNTEAVSVNAFTAVSPPSLMHEDICKLALDKEASLMLLPFHQRWCHDGTIQSEDSDIRILNSTILEKAPCTVGILIDRSPLRQSLSRRSISMSSMTLFNVAMIFLGGKDDREALVYTKRMAEDNKARLTVMVLKTAKRASMLDTSVLKDVKKVEGVTFVETEVEGGSQTAMILRPVAQDYDLIVVGRGNDQDRPQTSGLKEWSEIPELGIIGDLLASTDFEGTCSILVIQQQKTIRSRHPQLSRGTW